jgi:hypothetical protein
MFTTVFFPHTATPYVLSVSPPVGPAAGGTVVTLVGLAVGSDAMCDFGGATGVDATMVSASLLKCTAPAAALGSVAVEFSNDFGFTYTGSGVQFIYAGTYPSSAHRQTTF